MDIANLQVGDGVIVDAFAYPVEHFARRSVGECQTEHVVIRHTMVMGIAYPLGEGMRLAASRRSKNKVIAVARLYDLALTVVQQG